jgi:ABC-type Fe3+-hydroxamate transport system substrate-binding protein
VAGITDFCVYPAEAVARLPRVGGTKNPDVAAILALQPDLVIANQEENRPEDVAALRAAGLPVWVTFPSTVRQALDLLWAVLRVFDAPQASRVVDVLERQVEWASQAAAAQPPARVFCPIWREPAAAAGPAEWYMTVNAGTYTHDLLRVCGGENVFAGRERRYPLAADLDPARPAQPAAGRDTRYPRVSAAEARAAAPEVVLLPSEPYPFGPADAAEWQAWPEVPAVRAGRVCLVDGSWLTWPGTHLAHALAELPARLAAPAA